MDSRRKSLILVAILIVNALSYFVVVLPVNVMAATLFVGGTGPGNYTSIQDAVNDSIAGDTVFVYSGTYEELLTINKGISLIGEDRNTTTISAPKGGGLIEISANYVRIEGFSLTHTIWGGAAITLDSVGMCNIVDNNISSNDVGIRIENGGLHRIADNVITDRGGILMYDTVENTISNNTIFGNSNNILLRNSHRNIISGNMILEGRSSGVSLFRSNKTVFTGNIISDNSWGVGIRILDSNDAILKDNQFHNDGIFIEGEVHENWHSHTIDTSNTANGRPVAYWKNVTGGVVPAGSGQVILFNCTNTLIENQNLSRASIGVHSIFSTGNTIINNDISYNDEAGIMLYWSDNSVIHNNSAVPSRADSSSGRAVDVEHSNSIIVTNNTASLGIIRLSYSNDSYVANNTLNFGYGNGIQVWGSNNVIANNTVSEYSKGFSVGFSHLLIENNTALANRGAGISLVSSGNCTIRFNNASMNRGSGISVAGSDNVTVTHNSVSQDNYYGIHLAGSDNSLITDNDASRNLYSGIHLGGNNNTLARNEMVEDGIYIWGGQEDWNSHSIDTSNTVNGRPVRYWKDVEGGTVSSGAGQVILANCTNVKVKDQNVSHGSVGILIGYSHNNTVSNNTVMFSKMQGLYLLYSDWNLVEKNTASFNFDYGIRIQLSENNTVVGNLAVSNEEAGLSFRSTPNSTVTDNIAIGNRDGLHFQGAEFSVVHGNIATMNQRAGIIESSFHVTVSNNNASHNEIGIDVHSYMPTVVNNTVLSNRQYGILLSYSRFAFISGNMMIDNGFFISGSNVHYWTSLSIDTSNTVNGKPVYYWKNITGGTIPTDAGQVILANCTGVTMDSLNVSHSSAGIIVGYSMENKITNNIASYNSDAGILLHYSDNSTISGNIASHNLHGIHLWVSENANITGNTMVENGIYFNQWPTYVDTLRIDSSNTVNGKPVYYWKNISGGVVPPNAGQIILVNCSDVTIRNQNVSNGSIGITVTESSNISVYDNTASFNSGEGITTVYSSGISIFNNSVTHNNVGINSLIPDSIDIIGNIISENEVGAFFDWLYFGPVRVFHNNFIENLIQIQFMLDPAYPSSWDDGYPSGGNYWSDYSGVDNCSGPGQDICPDPDGIGDTPYEIDWYESDRYPLMIPFSMDPSRPFSPQNLKATPGNEQVVLTWSAPYDGGSPITNYRIYRGPTSGGEVFLTEIGNVLTYMDIGLVNGKTYYYMVSAVNAIGEGPRSSEASATPGTIPTQPINLTATAGNQQVSLEWEPPDSNGGHSITNYRIYRGTTPGGEVFLIEVGNVTSYVDTGLSSGQTYYYMVSAVNAVGEGPKSNEASATPIAVPTPPLNLTATSGYQQVTLDWEPPSSNGGSSITNYRIYRGTTSGGKVFLTEVGNVTSYVDTGLSSGQTYYYQVSAVNAIGEGPKSNEASATTPTDPGPPMDLQAVLSGSNLENVTIGWSLSSDDGGGQNSVIGYAIYRNTSYDTDGTGYGLIAFLTNGTTEYTDVSVGDGDTNSYFYQICAVDVNNRTSCAEEQAAKYAKHLAKGMILLSIPLDVSNNSITSIFQTVSYSRVLSYDAKAGKKHNWMVFDKKKPWSKSFDANHTMALWVDVTTESYLTIAGVVPKSTTIHLKVGWNFVGYSSFIDRTVSDTLSTHYQTIETFDPTDSPWYLRRLGDTDLMMAGEGYWIHVSQDYDWVLTN